MVFRLISNFYPNVYKTNHNSKQSFNVGTSNFRSIGGSVKQLGSLHSFVVCLRTCNFVRIEEWTVFFNGKQNNYYYYQRAANEVR